MANIGNMMKQAQQMQEKMQEVRKQLADLEITGEAGGGMVQITLNGHGEMKKITLSPETVDDLEILEDLIIAAHNTAKNKMEQTVSQETQKAFGDLNLPFKLPF